LSHAASLQQVPVKAARPLAWWSLLLGPAAVAVVVLASRVYPAFDQLDAQLDRIAPFLVICPVAVYAVRVLVTRNPLSMVLWVLSASLFCRELHFAGTDTGIYVMVAGVVIWAVAWRNLLAESLKDRRHTIWLLATLSAYLLSQLIARRVFRFVPGEQAIHSKLEEGVETMGHLMLFVTSLSGRWTRYRPLRGRGAGEMRPGASP